VFLCVGHLPGLGEARGQHTNGRVNVSIVWPRDGDWWENSFSVSTLIKIKAAATCWEGSFAQVQFFVETNLIGIVTNAPFNLPWALGDVVGINPTNSAWILKAVAFDTSGASNESSAVKIGYFTGIPPWPVLEITAPMAGESFAAQESIPFSAEVFAGPSGDAGPVEFFVGSNSIALVDQDAILTRTTPPSSITLSNLPEGEHELSVRFRGGDGLRCHAIGFRGRSDWWN